MTFYYTMYNDPVIVATDLNRIRSGEISSILIDFDTVFLQLSECERVYG
jgi:hypothetical protein